MDTGIRNNEMSEPTKDAVEIAESLANRCGLITISKAAAALQVERDKTDNLAKEIIRHVDDKAELRKQVAALTAERDKLQADRSRDLERFNDTCSGLSDEINTLLAALEEISKKRKI